MVFTLLLFGVLVAGTLLFIFHPVIRGRDRRTAPERAGREPLATGRQDARS